MRHIILTTMLLLVACTPTGPAAEFRQALDDGAPCSALFDLRNQLDPDDPTVEQLNGELRRVGCHSSTSTRTD